MNNCSNCKHKVLKNNSIFTDCNIATCEKENLLLVMLGKKGICTYHEKED